MLVGIIVKRPLDTWKILTGTSCRLCLKLMLYRPSS